MGTAAKMFTQEDFEQQLSNLSDQDIDDLVVGAVEIDEEGNIVSYNKREGEITGRDPEDVKGKNFFTDIAPCTDTEAFKGRFKEDVVEKGESTMFEYTFDYKMKPTKVQVYMKNALISDNYWIFIKEMSA